MTYEYDTLSRITAIRYEGAIVAHYEYDDLSRRTLLTYGNDANMVYSYDIGNRLTKLSNNVSDTNITFDYTSYDKVSNRKSCKINDANTQVYDYDKLYQLTYVDYNDSNKTWYYYDKLGNRTKVTKNTTDTLYDANALNQYKTVGGANYNYDKNGNLADINNSQFQYVYDCENRLIEAKENSVSVAIYKYDFTGRRVQKTVNGGQTTAFCYDGDQIIAEYQGDILVRKFIYSPGIDEPICMITSEGFYYYHFDGLGSVVALSGEDNQIVEKYSYDVYGEPNRTSSVGNPYFFTAREYDIETGNYYYRARYYRPHIGRFLQTDPIGYFMGLNLYAYCINNPLNFRDSMGLLLERIFSDPVERAEHYEDPKETREYSEFVAHAGGKSLRDLQHEMDRGRQASDTSARGPAAAYRYVIDPANNLDVIDMRHFLVVGPQGETFGLVVEFVQLSGDNQSAFHSQDFLSNKLGKDFYQNYYLKLKDLYPLDVILNAYFQDRLMQAVRDKIEKSKCKGSGK